MYRAVCPLCNYQSKVFDSYAKAAAADRQHQTAVAHRKRIARAR
jgi:hypothetical protein